MRNSDDDISRCDTRCQEHKAKCIGAAVHTDAVFRIAKLRKFALKLLDHWPTDKTGRVESLFHDAKQFSLELLMRRYEIKEGNFRCACHGYYFFSSEIKRRNLAGF